MGRVSAGQSPSRSAPYHQHHGCPICDHTYDHSSLLCPIEGAQKRPQLGLTTTTMIPLHLHPRIPRRQSPSLPQTKSTVVVSLVSTHPILMCLISYPPFPISHTPCPISYNPYLMPHIPNILSLLLHPLPLTNTKYSVLFYPGMASPEQAPPRYSLELAAIPRHAPLGQLPPMEPRPSSPVTLPSFNSLDSFIRGCSPPSPHMNRHSQNGSLSSAPHIKPWKSENINMVIDQPSTSPTLAGQQLNVPAPSLPTGYPGYAHSTPPFSLPSHLLARMRLLLGDTQRKSRVETQIKQLITLEFNGERVTQYQYIHVTQSASVKRYKMPPKNVSSMSRPTLPESPGIARNLS